MTTNHVDVLLVGAGIMSATLGTLLKQMNPSFKMAMVEQMADIMQESSSAWHNAGTGHAAYCELNYTPQAADGSINYDKAYFINSAFEMSLQFWAALVKQQALPEPSNFINPVPHMSFVWGEENVAFLRKRYEHLSQHPLFKGMEFSDDPSVLREWVPLVMEGRDPHQKVAATRVDHGSDVNFGAVGRYLVQNLQKSPDFQLHLNYEVQAIDKQADGSWLITPHSNSAEPPASINAKFVFLGGGGAALNLLQMSGIEEGLGYGGFPVSGQWLVCNREDIVPQHYAKVYGKASIGAPPMSVPHLDTRIIDGKRALLFGPFAGFTTKFLKQGSIFDLFSSIRPSNLVPMVRVGLTSMDLIKYLVTEVMQTHEARVNALREYYPNAKADDWKLEIAGQRVQIIKKDPKKGGKLEFGTEVVTASDNSLAVLLGASPGASVAVQAMMQIVERCFKASLATPEWKDKLHQLVPSYGKSLVDDEDLLQTVRQYTLSTLKLAPVQTV